MRVVLCIDGHVVTTPGGDYVIVGQDHPMPDSDDTFRVWVGEGNRLVLSLYTPHGEEQFWYDLTEADTVALTPGGVMVLVESDDAHIKIVEAITDTIRDLAYRQACPIHSSIAIVKEEALAQKDQSQDRGNYLTDGDWKEGDGQELVLVGGTFVAHVERNDGLVTGITITATRHCGLKLLNSALATL